MAVMGGNVCICSRRVCMMGLKLNIKVVCSCAQFGLLQSGLFTFSQSS